MPPKGSTPNPANGSIDQFRQKKRNIKEKDKDLVGRQNIGFSKLQFGQLNVRASWTCVLLLLQSIMTISLDVLLIQDPPWRMKSLNTLHGWQVFLPEVDEEERLTCMLVSPRLRVQNLHSPLGRFTAISIRLESQALLLGSGYFRHSDGLGIHLIQNWLLSHHLDKKWILGIDCNGQSPLWGPPSLHTNKVGLMVEQFITELGLGIANDCQSVATFFNSDEKGFWLDVSLFSHDLPIINWRVLDNIALITDHQLVCFDLNLMFPKHQKMILNWRMAPWSDMAHSIQEQLLQSEHHTLSGGIDRTTLQARLQDFMQACHMTVHRWVPSKEQSFRSRPWWTSKLQTLKMELKNLTRRGRRYHQRHGSPLPASLRANLTAARREYKNAIAKAKRDQWRSSMASCTNNSVWNTFRALSKPRSHISFHRLVDASNQVTTNPVAMCNMLRDQFFPSLQEPEATHQASRPTPGEAASTRPMHMSFPQITPEELHSHVRRGKQYGAAGHDHLPHIFWTKLLPEIEPWLLYFYNTSIELQYVPEEWKRAVIVPVPKTPAHGDHITKMRPISLLPTISKVLESIVNHRLMTWSISHQKLHARQFGFRVQHSTVGALHNIMNILAQGQSKGGNGILISLDLKTAFDRIWRPRLLEILCDKQVPIYIQGWLRSFLDDRVGFINAGGHSKEFPIPLGTPQGSPISPCLFLFYIDPLLQMPLMQDLFAFADDLSICCHGPWAHIFPRVQHQLDIIDSWCQAQKMHLSLSKCSSLIVGRQPEGDHTYFHLGGHQLSRAPHIKLLGVYIDCNLTFDYHLSQMIGRGTMVLQHIHKMAGQFWGLSAEVLSKLVRSVLWPTIFYGSGIWAAYMKQPHLKKLESLLRRAQIMITGCLSTTSHTALGALSGELPGRLRLIYESYRDLQRLQHTGHMLPSLSQGNLATSLFRSYTGRILRSVGLRGHIIPLPLIQSAGEREQRLNQMSINIMTKSPRMEYSYRHAYLHIACEERQDRLRFGWSVHWGAMSQCLTKGCRGLYDSWYISILACIEGLQVIKGWIDTCEPKPSNIYIIGGSQQMHAQLSSQTNRHKEVDLLRLELHNMRDLFPIMSQKPLHDRSTYMLQNLQNLVKMSPINTQNIPWSPWQTLRRLEEILAEQWSQEIATAPTGHGLIDTGVEFVLDRRVVNNLPRYQSGILNQFLTDHYPSRPYLTRFKVKQQGGETSTDQRCICGAPWETREHVLWWCPSLTIPRAELLEHVDEPTWTGLLKNLPHLATFLTQVRDIWHSQGRAWGPA